MDKPILRKLIGFAAIPVLILGSAFWSPQSAYALPTADLRYTELDAGGGLWQYSYIFYNSTDPVLEPGYDLYEVDFFFDSSADFTLLTLSDGWDNINGSGFAGTYSLNFGAHPIGTDVAPGNSISGFSFLIDYRARGIDFEAYFTDPLDPFAPAIYAGVSAVAESSQPVSSVPEPNTIVLFGSGILLASIVRRYFKGFQK